MERIKFATMVETAPIRHKRAIRNLDQRDVIAAEQIDWAPSYPRTMSGVVCRNARVSHLTPTGTQFTTHGLTAFSVLYIYSRAHADFAYVEFTISFARRCEPHGVGSGID